MGEIPDLNRLIPEAETLFCPGLVVLQSESPILVWELGGCLPEGTCFILQ